MQYLDIEVFFNKVTRKIDYLFHDYLNKKIFFLHIPKCGGTSIRKALESCYSKSDFKPSNIIRLNASASLNVSQNLTSQNLSIFQIREILLLYYMFSGCKLISGHFPFSQVAYDNFFNEYNFLTILRNPVDRFISEYFFNRYTKKSHRKDTASMSIEKYLDSDYGKLQGTQYVRFLTGTNLKDHPTSQIAIDQAKENLAKFTLVGCLEYQQDFLIKFEKIFEKKLQLPRLNKNPISENQRKNILNPEITKTIEVLCKPDIEIYEYAVNSLIKD